MSQIVVGLYDINTYTQPTVFGYVYNANRRFFMC